MHERATSRRSATEREVNRRRSFEGREHGRVRKDEEEKADECEGDRRESAWKGCTRALDADLEGTKRTKG